MKSFKDYILEYRIQESTYPEKPFSTVDDIKVKYGTLSDIVKIINDGNYVYGGKQGEGNDGFDIVIDLPGKFNKNAWQGYSKPKRTYGVKLSCKKVSGKKWFEITTDDVEELKAVYYNRYEGTYSYGSNDIKDTKNIPVQVD